MTSFFDELEGQTFTDGPGSDHGVFAIIDPLDLANGQHAGGKIPFDKDFLDKLAWMCANDGVPEVSEYRPFTHLRIPAGATPGTTIFLFSAGDRHAAIDCTAIHMNAGSALAGLHLNYGLVRPLQTYQGPPTPTADNPVGKLIPGYNFMYAFADGADPTKYADDSTLTITLPDGQTEKYLRTRVMAPGGTGGPFQQNYKPAWRHMGR